MASVGLDIGCWKSRDGIFKIVEFVISLLVIILTAASQYTLDWEFVNGDKFQIGQMAYVVFVGSFSCITLVISALMYCLKLYNLPLCDRLPWKIVELVYAVLCAILNLVSIAIAGYTAGYAKPVPPAANNPPFYGLFCAGAVFSSILFVIYLLHAFLIWKGSPPRSDSSSKPTEIDVSV